ncbi:hypothetical protein [Occallatibacter riparius]|uniref:Uncharacterized protein n=1 Tax=Occallatibacter riparius TaxID=1002689 RepID=A0A9J7BMI9_9BACT|nr:hypothetical protein [Occallatibacter riparius]UWZ83899.1 hypothetical protein MOP44_25495 [Occallatibacter riparius]
MKQLGFTLMLFLVVLSPLAAVCQATAPPATQTASTQNAPQALTPPDKEWRKIQKLPRGTYLVVGNTYGPALACRMAAATDDALFCDAAESPGGQGWQFDRATVISVEATVLRKNHHPVWIGATIASGLLIGISAARNHADAGTAAAAGVTAAAVAGVVGAPIALSEPDGEWVTVVYRPRVARQNAAVPNAH